MLQTVLDRAQVAAGGGYVVNGILDDRNGTLCAADGTDIHTADAKSIHVHIVNGHIQLVEAVCGVSDLERQTSRTAALAGSVGKTQILCKGTVTHIFEAEGYVLFAAVLDDKVAVVAHSDGEISLGQAGQAGLRVISASGQAVGGVPGVDSGLDIRLQLGSGSGHCGGAISNRASHLDVDLGAVDIHLEDIVSGKGFAVISQRSLVDAGSAVTGAAHDNAAHDTCCNVTNSGIAAQEGELGIHTLVVALNSQNAGGIRTDSDAGIYPLGLGSIVDDALQILGNALDGLVGSCREIGSQLAGQLLRLKVIGPVNGDLLPVNGQIVLSSLGCICGCQICFDRSSSHLGGLGGSDICTAEGDAVNADFSTAQGAVQQLDTVEVGGVGDTVNFTLQRGHFLLEVLGQLHFGRCRWQTGWPGSPCG